MAAETKTCQNCEADFRIEPADFDLYKQIEVTPPTWCPECRRQRRYTWRNERTLYKRKCDLCKSEIIAMYRENAPFPVYCHPCWYSDKWDPAEYGQDYDFSTPFFKQYHDLFNKVPRFNFFQRQVTNGDYSNFSGENKNVYLSYSIVNSEEIYYSRGVDDSSNVFDCLNVSGLETCYGGVYYGDSNKSHFLFQSLNCIDSWFLFDCFNCQDCILSHNLRNKRYVIRNKQYSREEYQKLAAELDFGSYRNLEELKQEFRDMVSASLHRYADIFKSANSTGAALSNAKDSKACFEAWDLENVHYLVRGYHLKDSSDVDFTIGSQYVYEYVSGGRDMSRIRFSTSAISDLNDVHYTDSCGSASYLFGCIGLRNKKYCILNKQYSQEEYEEMMPRIIEHMNEMPYADKKDRIYKYGEFFPPELSPFAYNETIAQEYFPLTKKEVVGGGFAFKEPETKKHSATKTPEDLPDHIEDVSDEITQEVIQCAHGANCDHQCTAAFKIIPQELQLYRQIGLPLPRLCPNCRHYGRLAQKNPLRLWRRRCQCGGGKSENGAYQNTSTDHQPHPAAESCPTEFETAYAPDRPETVYCEQCYQAEVV